MTTQLYVVEVTRTYNGESYKTLHSGGRGNGAHAGLYAKTQLARILGRYPKGTAVAIPVALGYTQATAEENASEAHILGHARNHGVDNWDGWGDWGREACCGEEDSDE